MKLRSALFIAACLLLLSCLPALSADIQFDLTTAKVTLNQRGVVTAINLPDGATAPRANEASFNLTLKGWHCDLPRVDQS